MNIEAVRAWLASPPNTATPEDIEIVRSRFEAAEKLFVSWKDNVHLLLMEQCWQQRDHIFKSRLVLLIQEWWLEIPGHGQLHRFTFSGEPLQNNQYPVLLNRDTRENVPYTAHGLDFVLVFKGQDS